MLHSLLYGFRTEVVVTMHVKIHHDVFLLEVKKQRPGCEDCSNCLQTKRCPLLLLTSLVSEGDVLLYDAIQVQVNSVRLFQKSDKIKSIRSSSSITCDMIESSSNYLRLDEYIRQIITFDSKCKELQQKPWQSKFIITKESIRKHIESTVMVDTTISFFMHRSSAATQQSTVYSYAYLFSQSNRHASSIVLLSQRNSWCYPDS